MSIKHQRKFVINVLIGLLLTAVGISIIFYACFTKGYGDDWKLWALITAVLVCTGLLFMSSAIVHKVKADFIRKQKGRSERREPA
jgi:high-affinity Fe2+/Pb2+ permease